ncbi:MAG: aminopeptidase P family N-terminal domain-containing protein, partial [Planctomycetota bacterium]|nr:aminopeptidase P family N-terminal domain-containing protein [Planctomycetota bacterium]
MTQYARRRDRLRRRMKKSQLKHLLVTNEVNVTYLTGFSGDSSYLL